MDVHVPGLQLIDMIILQHTSRSLFAQKEAAGVGIESDEAMRPIVVGQLIER